MKNTLFTTLVLIGFCGLVFIWTRIQPAGTPIDKVAQKHEPSDLFFLQRSYPDGQFSIAAYTEALRQAKNEIRFRENSGFDHPWVPQGPGNIGARINTVAAHPENEDIIYVGFSAGGVFKTVDGGENWEPIFDDQLFLAIGDIVLDPNDPDIVYVGTGDVNITGYPFIGDGLYRSTDAGATWEHLGLTEQRIISKIIIDPTDSDVLYVACMGLPFERNNDRGLYKSVDGGERWEQVLFLGDGVGVIDLLLNPENPQVLYAAGWNRIRNNVESIISGSGARLHKSIDGGQNWTMVEGGLPNAEHSRMGLAMSGTDPDVLFVQYVGTDSELEDIYKTTDGGMNWSPIPTDPNTGLFESALGGFGWYFGKIRVNPNDDNDIFLLGVSLWRTVNGGEQWDLAVPPSWLGSVHVDKHDLVFLPSGDALLATDGGLYRSNEATEEWEDVENIPATQFYKVAYNPHEPQNYFGGAQDNGHVKGNGLDINQWERLMGGDGFRMLVDPINSDRFFFELQRGSFTVTLNGGVNFIPADDGISSSDRRNWDMPYIMSPHDPQELYAGTFRVYKGVGDVPEWEPISEDLSDGTAEQHRYHNITSLDESTLIPGLLYAGTGDGNAWRKDENDMDWTSITSDLIDQYITSIKASPYDPDVVFVTHSGYRDNDFIPHIHRSDDRGANWQDISSNLPNLAINDLFILPDHADSVLFVATDGGIYGTVNGGLEWERLGNNMPVIAVYDLTYHEENNELIAGTHARAILTYPIDSIPLGDPVLTSTDEAATSAANLLACFPNPARDYVRITLPSHALGADDLALQVLDAKGQVIYQVAALANPVDHELRVADWGVGVYFVRVNVGEQFYVRAFLKY